MRMKRGYLGCLWQRRNLQVLFCKVSSILWRDTSEISRFQTYLGIAEIQR
jgi:hypothetical protein